MKEAIILRPGRPNAQTKPVSRAKPCPHHKHQSRDSGFVLRPGPAV